MTRAALRVAVAALLLAAGAVARAGQSESGSWYHEFVMKGSVIDVAEEEIYFCIGTPDGARVGQEYDAIHISRVVAGRPKGAPRFQHVKVGRVRVEEIVDVHYARARVIAGKIEKGDLIALAKKEL